MMKKIFKYITLSALCLGFISCVEDGRVPRIEDNKALEYTADALPGQLLVRFSTHVSNILDQVGLTKSGPSLPLTRSGLLSVDEVLELVGAYEIERVFPVDKRTETTARKEGLHLWYVVRFSEEHSVEEVAKNLSQLGEVSRVEFNRQLKRATAKKAIPLTADILNTMTKAPGTHYFNDPLLPRQWHLDNKGRDFATGNLNGTYPEPNKFTEGADVNVVPAWQQGVTGHPDIVVAVLDEGVDTFHEDLKASMWVNEAEVFGSDEDADGNGYKGDRYGYNFVQNKGQITTNNPYDTGHGTHVAGVIAATNNNGVGISSIAGGTPDRPGVRIMSCQIFAGMYAGSVLDEVRAIKYAADNGAHILQCSWGYISSTANPYENQPSFGTDEEWMTINLLEYNALNYFINHAGSPDGVLEGGIAVFAAGNEYAPSAGYPGAYPQFVSVAATAGDFSPATYSNYGPGITVSAPGGDQDYYYEYGEGPNMGALGCVLSTIPVSVTGDNGDFTGYGYMEGTSMACPHVSGVIALGLSQAAQSRLHYKAQDVIELLYKTATPLDDYMTGTKMYYRYVSDLGQLHPMSIDMDNYKGMMGRGQVNTAAFINEMGQSGVQMTFPNILIEVGEEKTYLPSRYFKNGESLTYTVSVDNSKVAAVEMVGKKLIVIAKSEGQTNLKVKPSNGAESNAVITVRKQANHNGWM